MAIGASDFRRLERSNRRRSAALIILFALLVTGLGLCLDLMLGNLAWQEDGEIVGFPTLSLAALIIASVQAAISYYGGSSLILAAMHARPLEADSPKNLMALDVVREMAIAARVPTPKVYVIDDPAPNAFATGRDPAHAAICLTQGLIDTMDREQLQGVVGHEMAHIRNYDTRLMTMVAVMVGAVALLADFLHRWIWFGGFGRNNSERKDAAGGGFAPALVVIVGILSPLISRLIAMAISRQREYLADAASVEFTRNPRGLLRALEQIAAQSSPLKHAFRATAHLFIVNPMTDNDSEDGEGIFDRLFSTHPPLKERIARLRAMLGESGSSVAVRANPTSIST